MQQSINSLPRQIVKISTNAIGIVDKNVKKTGKTIKAAGKMAVGKTMSTIRRTLRKVMNGGFIARSRRQSVASQSRSRSRSQSRSQSRSRSQSVKTRSK